MWHNASAFLLPMILAFLAFIAKFYGMENAAAKSSPSFLLAMFMVALLTGYLVMVVTGTLFAYAALSFGVAGCLFLALAIYMFWA